MNFSIFLNQDHTFIIAEIGSNHGNQIQTAKESIDAACQAGADAVKFQSINMEELFWDPKESDRELHKKIDLEESWHEELKQYCDSRGILFFSSPTYMQAVNILESINVKLYKLASAQIGVFPQLVEKVASLCKPTLLSTGLVTPGELEKSIKLFQKHN